MRYTFLQRSGVRNSFSLSISRRILEMTVVSRRFEKVRMCQHDHVILGYAAVSEANTARKSKRNEIGERYNEESYNVGIRQRLMCRA